MKRNLRPDAQAIALPDPHSHFGRLKYVFDVRETQPLPGAPEFRQWSLPFEALERVTDRLGQEYGISRDPVVADRVYALVMNAAQELYPMQLAAMLRAADAEGRWSGQDDAALARQFHQLVADSAAYMAGVRVGVGAGAVTADALENITRFNSPGLAALAGTYASRLAASVLRDIERTAKKNDRLAIPARGVQNEGREEFSHAAEAAKEVKDNDIHDTERRALSGPDAGRTGGSTGQIRPATPPIPGEKRPRPAKISSKTSLFLLLLVISTLTIIPYLGLTNFHTKGEPREAIVAVSMLQNDNWILPINNGGDIAYKPPFFHWCIAALSLPAGEVTEFTSRLPSALAAIIMAIACFLFFAKRSRNDIAFLASLLLLSGFEVHRAAMASRVDMVLTCFIVLAMLQLYRWWELGLKGIPIWAILFMSIATLTKGPVGIVLPCAVIGIFLLFQKVSVWKAFYKIIPIALLSCILPLLWYYAAYQQGGEAFLRLVMEENVDRFLGKMSYGSHEQPIIYYVYITLAGWLPWSLLVIMSLFTLKYKRPQGTVKLYWERFKDYITHMDKMRLFSLLSIVIIFVFYCIPKSKRSVYILPIYPFIAYFLAEYMLFLLKQRPRIWRIFSIFIAFIGGFLLVVLTIVKSGIIDKYVMSSTSDISHYVTALSESWDIIFIITAIFIVFLIYDIYKSKRYLTYNNRYLYSVVALFFGIQLMLDASTLPAILNAKSMKPFADKVVSTDPNGEIYSYVESSMMRFFIINFYAQNRVIDFEKEMPKNGYLLVGERDFNYIKEKYGEQYTFEQTLRSDRKGNDVKDYILLFNFQQNTAE